MLSHTVFFTLSDKADEARSSLIAAMFKHLKPHDGVANFFAGQRIEEYQREVNDKEFDVSLAIVFETREAHDAYQVSEPHNTFIEECKGNWAKVRVFDTELHAG